MASIDWSMVGLGALIGVGCRKQLKSAGRIAANTAASLAGVAAQAAAQVARETAEKQAQPSGQNGQPQAGQDPNNPNG